jgi:uncharacterized protein YbaR (Trm112 family)
MGIKCQKNFINLNLGSNGFQLKQNDLKYYDNFQFIKLFIINYFNQHNKGECKAIFVAPQSHKKLVLNKNKLVLVDGKENYSIIKGVPILLYEKTNSDWSRELLEIIF